MFVVVALLALVGVTLGTPVNLEVPATNRSLSGPYGIVGGTTAAISDFPWQVSVQYFNLHFCGGTIISSQWVLTAAHCFDQIRSNINVRVGSNLKASGGQTSAVSGILIHSNYVALTADNDIALLHLRTALTLNANVKAVSLPNQGEDVAQGTTITVTGWGDTFEGSEQGSPVLLKVDIPVIQRARCSLSYTTGVNRITENMICAGLLGVGGKDSCQGDSGGPATVGTKLVGVVSWGGGCARPSFPGVYARVGIYRDWIKQNTGV